MSIHQREIGPKELKDRAITGSIIAHDYDDPIGLEGLYFDGYRYYDNRVPRCTTFARNDCYSCIYFTRCNTEAGFDPAEVARRFAHFGNGNS